MWTRILGQLFWGAAPLQVLQTTLCSNSLRNLSKFSTSGIYHLNTVTSSWDGVLIFLVVYSTCMESWASEALKHYAGDSSTSPCYVCLTSSLPVHGNSAQEFSELAQLQHFVILYLCKTILWKVIISKSEKKTQH